MSAECGKLCGQLRVPVTEFVPCRPFTAAERRLLPHLAEGKEYKSIAVEVGCSTRVVEAHVARMAAKLPGASKPQLRVTLYAVRWWAEGEIARRTAAAIDRAA